MDFCSYELLSGWDSLWLTAEITRLCTEVNNQNINNMRTASAY